MVLMSPEIRLIDFGSATNYAYCSDVVTTKSYRAPEIILSIGKLKRGDLHAFIMLLTASRLVT